MIAKKVTTESLEKKAVAKQVIKKTSASKDTNSGDEFFTITKSEERLLQKHLAMKLQIELVPAKCFWSNVRSNVKGSEWDRIRFKVYEKANFLCEICECKGTKHPVECHEVWVYDDVYRIQRLSHFQSLCPLCHEVKHMGLAGIRGNGDRAFNRFSEINQIDQIQAEKIKSAVFKQWRIRSKQDWILDINHLLEWGISPKVN